MNVRIKQKSTASFLLKVGGTPCPFREASILQAGLHGVPHRSPTSISRLDVTYHVRQHGASTLAAQRRFRDRWNDIVHRHTMRILSGTLGTRSLFPCFFPRPREQLCSGWSICRMASSLATAAKAARTRVTKGSFFLLLPLLCCRV